MATNHYVKNSELREEIILCNKNDVLSEEAINMFIILAKKYSNKYQ